MRAATRFAAYEWLLLDFDGPVCSVFAGYPAPDIAAELVGVAATAGVRVPADTDDPHEVLRIVYASTPGAAGAVESALQDAELKAVDSAAPTAGALELLERCAATDRRVAIVSNNHGPAVQKYLELHDLSEYVAHVSGRNASDMELMKPNPYLLFEAMRDLRATAARTAFVGDSISDMQAGRSAAVLTIGYANKPGKKDRLATAGADLIVTSMSTLAAEL